MERQLSTVATVRPRPTDTTRPTKQPPNTRPTNQSPCPEVSVRAWLPCCWCRTLTAIPSCCCFVEQHPGTHLSLQTSCYGRLHQGFPRLRGRLPLHRIDGIDSAVFLRDGCVSWPTLVQLSWILLASASPELAATGEASRRTIIHEKIFVKQHSWEHKTGTGTVPGNLSAIGTQWSTVVRLANASESSQTAGGSCPRGCSHNGTRCPRCFRRPARKHGRQSRTQAASPASCIRSRYW